MEHVRSLTRALVAVAVLGSAGCITITPPAKPEPPKPQPQPAAGGVVQAGGTAATPVPPAPAGKPPAAPTVSVSMPKVSMKLPDRKVAAGEMAMAWSRRVEHLPDPAKDGAMGPGLVGQLFLYGTGPDGPVPATADGKLTVILYNETTDATGPKSIRLGQWVFEKEALKGLVTTDERWGKCYAIFLPWPTYTLDVTKVKLTGKFEPESGHPLYAPASVITIDTSVPGSNFTSTTSSVPLNSLPPGGPLGSAPGALPPGLSAPPAGGIPPNAWK